MLESAVMFAELWALPQLPNVVVVVEDGEYFVRSSHGVIPAPLANNLIAWCKARENRMINAEPAMDSGWRVDDDQLNAEWAFNTIERSLTYRVWARCTTEFHYPNPLNAPEP